MDLYASSTPTWRTNKASESAPRCLFVWTKSEDDGLLACANSGTCVCGQSWPRMSIGCYYTRANGPAVQSQVKDPLIASHCLRVISPNMAAEQTSESDCVYRSNRWAPDTTTKKDVAIKSNKNLRRKLPDLPRANLKFQTPTMKRIEKRESRCEWIE